MKHLLLILALLCAPLTAAPAQAQAQATRYALEPDISTVRFSYTLNGSAVEGQMPVTEADLTLDFANLAASSARVTLNAARARAGLVFATDAMRGKSVLDTAQHPEIRFTSTAVRGTPQAAQLDGLVTIRGIERPVTLEAKLYRQRGSDPGALDKLSILLTGTVDRRDFGAAGYPELVGPDIALTILARIQRLD